MSLLKISFVLVICMLIWCESSFAQEVNKAPNVAKIGIAYAWWGDNDLVYFTKLEGAPDYNGEKFKTFGLHYLYPLNDWLELETGVEYSKHRVYVLGHVPPTLDMAPEKTETDISIINIPVTVRANFLKFFFVNGGLMLHTDVNSSNRIDAQTGIGGLLGIGARYEFDFGVSVFANPYVKTYSLLPFSSENYYERLMESGIRFGITYDLD